MSTLKDLNTHLFAQLDRLAKADKSELDAEVKRAQTIAQVSENIIDASNKAKGDKLERT